MSDRKLIVRSFEPNIPITNRELYMTVNDRINLEDFEKKNLKYIGPYSKLFKSGSRGLLFGSYYEGRSVSVDFSESDKRAPIKITGTRKQDLDRTITKLSNLLKMGLDLVKEGVAC